MGVIKQLKDLKHAFNAFSAVEANQFQSWGNPGASYGYRPDRTRMRSHNDKSIVSSIYNQIGIDASAIDMFHVRLDRDKNDRYKETIRSGLNYCLTREANLDEASRAFKQNIVMTMFDKGTVAIVPVDTDVDTQNDNVFDIKTMRVGEIVAWFPEHVRVSLYNQKTGIKQELTLKKNSIAIVENPLYATMNDQNSTLQRLIRKLSLLDSLDEQTSSGKLDLIIQLPYVIKSESRRQQADQRRADIENQLKGSKYGIAYTDGTEKVTQLNRPAENNMHEQVKDLTAQLYNQLGLTAEVFEGTASEGVMLNYFNRTLEPVLSAIAQAMERSFISKTGWSQGQAVRFYRNPFTLVSMKDLAEIGDKLTRNEILSSNEMRGFIGLKPSTDKRADELRNANMPVQDTPDPPPDTTPEREEELQNGSTDRQKV